MKTPAFAVLLAAAGLLSINPLAQATTPTLTVLTSFAYDGNGYTPQGKVVVDANGNIYGTTVSTVFQLAAGTHAFTKLADLGSFSYASNGLITDASGNLYGATITGGLNNTGVIYEIPEIPGGSGTPITLNETFGTNSLVLDHDGNLYGIRRNSAVGGSDSVFEIPAGSNTPTTLATFNNVWQPDALVADPNGNIYGTTCYGGTYNAGTVFKIAAGTHAFTTLASPTGVNSFPSGTLAFDPYGNLVSGTNTGGGYMSVFMLPSGASAPTLITRLNPSYWNITSLISDANGNIFGTTSSGGPTDVRPFGFGTLFEIPAGAHTFTTLVAFDGANGDGPTSLMADRYGNLMGTTSHGGLYDAGTVFELTDSGYVVPEPASLFLLAFGATALLSRRRR